jgi:hypothetical protein
MSSHTATKPKTEIKSTKPKTTLKSTKQSVVSSSDQSVENSPVPVNDSSNQSDFTTQETNHDPLVKTLKP